MDINQYQPSRQTLVLSDMFCEYFGKTYPYYNFDLGNRIYKKVWKSVNGAITTDLKEMEESHYASQLVMVASELLKLFPTMMYNSDECNGLLSGLCNGRCVQLLDKGQLCRGIVTLRGVVWIDTFDHRHLDPDALHYEEMARIIKSNRDTIRLQVLALKRLL
ncbi:hypothetical protein AH06_36 [Erwinia phage AH06]|nr:hypothetical protein AH06_36 [Erwinia phage AH06]